MGVMGGLEEVRGGYNVPVKFYLTHTSQTRLAGGEGLVSELGLVLVLELRRTRKVLSDPHVTNSSRRG